jgi:hypothetical protein
MSIMEQLLYSVTTPVQVFEDNQACIKLPRNPINHSRTKHIDVVLHNEVEKKNLDVDYLKTENMLANALTKPLDSQQLREPSEAMGLDFSTNHDWIVQHLYLTLRHHSG